MIDIYHCMISKELTTMQWQKYFSLLPSLQKERNKRFKNLKDRYSHLFGRLLLKQGLLNKGYEENVLELIQTTDFDKPFISGPVDFNISHSKDYVICAISENCALGIDIEKIEPQFDISDNTGIFTPEEIEHIDNSPSQQAAFFRIWTRKESIIKANGKGLSLPLNKINCLPDEVFIEATKWHIQNIHFAHDYSASLCTSVNNPVINYFNTDFYTE
jgi:4'-phosphopantetheinyl transferase